jgi:uncharacterized protein YdiU (UPF0061 family)
MPSKQVPPTQTTPKQAPVKPLPAAASQDQLSPNQASSDELSLEQLSFSNKFYALGDSFYSVVAPAPLKKPFWLHINTDVMASLGLTLAGLKTPLNLDIFSGTATLADQIPIATVYSGHQFGGYTACLGDGRAMLIAQINTADGVFDLQLKGAGPTPYSRRADGRAVLRSSIREYLASEAMHQLGIATSRALCLVGSEEPVVREQVEAGATVARVARTHIRFGHFEYFHYTDQLKELKQLADHVIEQFLPQAVAASDKYNQLLSFSVKQTAKLIAQWQSVGFAHGVMNTDNMSIIGDTLDYGPYGFLDDYEPGFICNHSDHSGRYAFDQQPSIGLWNLSALAHALSSLIDNASIRDILARYEPYLIEAYADLMRNKLGLDKPQKNDHKLCSQLLNLMAQDKIDYTRLFRQLCDFKTIETRSLSDEAITSALNKRNTTLGELFNQKEQWQDWACQYNQRLLKTSQPELERSVAMKAVNPKFIARNHLLQQAIEKAEINKDYSDIDTLFMLLQTPFDEHAGFDHFAEPPKVHEKHLEISCSS